MTVHPLPCIPVHAYTRVTLRTKPAIVHALTYGRPSEVAFVRAWEEASTGPRVVWTRRGGVVGVFTATRSAWRDRPALSARTP